MEVEGELEGEVEGGSRVSKNGEWRMCVCSAQEADILATQRKEF